MLPVQWAIPGGALRYSTAEVLEAGELADRQFLILYDAAGRLVELALATRDEPRVEGETVYQYWDPEYESVVIGARVEKAERWLWVNDHLLVILLPRELALHTWTAELPARAAPLLAADSDQPRSRVVAPVISDAALLAASGSAKNRFWVELDFAPGERELVTFLPPLPAKCRVDGAPAGFQYDRHAGAARLQVSTPPLPARAFELSKLRTWTEGFDPSLGRWFQGPARALEELGPLPYGYVKYRAEFRATGAPGKMFISAFDDDGKKVFLNGRHAPEVSVAKKESELALDAYAAAGTNTLEIAYELFGSYNFGEKIANRKGIESVRLGADRRSAAPVGDWQVQLFPAPMRGRDLDPQFSLRHWTPGELTRTDSARELAPSFTWCRFEFTMGEGPEGWQIPWKLVFEAERDGLLYLNGKFLGRYVTAGPQQEFFLPEPPLIRDGRTENALTVVLAYARDARPIRALRVAPYEEFVLRRTRIEFDW